VNDVSVLGQGSMDDHLKGPRDGGPGAIEKECDRRLVIINDVAQYDLADRG
jgi:hypothetical protein